jgi:hypothetical protein
MIMLIVILLSALLASTPPGAAPRKSASKDLGRAASPGFLAILLAVVRPQCGLRSRMAGWFQAHPATMIAAA